MYLGRANRALRPTGRRGFGYSVADFARQIGVDPDRVLFSGDLVPGGEIQIAGRTIDLPDWPELPSVRLPIPTSATAYRSLLGRLEAAGEVAESLLRGDTLDAIAGAAALAPPPYGPAIAIGVKVAGAIINSLTRDPPPLPNLAGVPLDGFHDNPLRDENYAVLAGKVVSGAVREASDVELITRGVRIRLTAALNALVASPRDMNAVNRAVEGPPFFTSGRAVAYFCAYAGADKLFSPSTGLVYGAAGASTLALRQQIGTLLGWALPRVQIREMLWNWFLYRVALAAEVATDGHVDRYVNAQVMGWTRPVPGVDFLPEFSARGRSGWEWSRRLAGNVNHVYTPQSWAFRAARRAAPAPITIDSDSGPVWSYTPLDANILAGELSKYDRGAIAVIRDIPIPGADWWTCCFNRSDDACEEELTDFPESFATAAQLCIALATTDQEQMIDVEQGLALMRADTTPGVTITPGTREIILARQYAAWMRLAQARKAAPKTGTSAVVKAAKGVGAAGVVWGAWQLWKTLR